MGMYKVFTGPSVVTTLSISLVWIIYTAIPPFLLLHYAWVHRPDGSVGASLRHTCWVLWWISSFCGVAAILLLWLVYPQDYSYGAAVSTGLKFYPGLVRTFWTPPSSAAMLLLSGLVERWCASCGCVAGTIRNRMISRSADPER